MPLFFVFSFSYIKPLARSRSLIMSHSRKPFLSILQILLFSDFALDCRPAQQLFGHPLSSWYLYYSTTKRNLIQKLFYKMLQNALDNVGMCDIIENVGCELQQKMGKR